jgi:hypothetical protein
MQMRVIAAVAVLVSAAVHLWLWLDGMKDEGTVGKLFGLNVVAGVVIAILLVRWMHWVPPFLAAGFGFTTLVCFVIAATVGLFGLSQSWSGWEVWVAFASEIVAIVAGSIALLRSDHPLSAAQPQERGPVRR